MRYYYWYYMYVLTKEIQSCIFVVWSWCRPVRIIILNWWSESGLNGARARGWTCVVMGMVARGQVLVGSGAGKVNSTWVDVKGPDLHVCLFVCVCVGVECWNMNGCWGLWERLLLHGWMETTLSHLWFETVPKKVPGAGNVGIKVLYFGLGKGNDRS